MPVIKIQMSRAVPPSLLMNLVLHALLLVINLNWSIFFFKFVNMLLD